jgi:hypothetical protein
MVHSLRFRGGAPTYSNRFVANARLNFERALGRPFFLRIGEMFSVWGLLKLLLTRPLRIAAGGATALCNTVANTNMVMTPDARFLAVNEGAHPRPRLRRPGALPAALSAAAGQAGRRSRWSWTRTGPSHARSGTSCGAARSTFPSRRTPRCLSPCFCRHRLVFPSVLPVNVRSLL